MDETQKDNDRNPSETMRLRCPTCNEGFIMPHSIDFVACNKCGFLISLEDMAYVAPLHNYLWTIARKLEEHDRIPDFLLHFSKHLRKITGDCATELMPKKEDILAIKNMIGIYNIIQRDGGDTPKEAYLALKNHHEKTKGWSVDEDGIIKERQ